MLDQLVFDLNNFDHIPEEKGIYAFFLNLEYLTRTRARKDVTVSSHIEKAVRAHTICNPSAAKFRMYRRGQFNSSFSLDPAHVIHVAGLPKTLPPADFRAFASTLAKCTMITSPLYIGITESQTFRQRFGQHQQRFERHKDETYERGHQPEGHDMYTRGGEFYHKLVRRRLEFRDLRLVCVPLEKEEMQHCKHVEKFLHAIVCPSLSEA